MADFDNLFICLMIMFLENISENKNNCEYLKISLSLRAEAYVITIISLQTHNYVYLILIFKLFVF